MLINPSAFVFSCFGFLNRVAKVGSGTIQTTFLAVADLRQVQIDNGTMGEGTYLGFWGTKCRVALLLVPQ